MSYTLPNRNKALAAVASAVFLWPVAALTIRHHASSAHRPSFSHPEATRLPGQEEASHCRRYRLPLLDPSLVPRRKIYDLLLANSELEMLELRLGELYPHVDYFVIPESDVTFTGHPKPLHIREHWNLFSPFNDKMILRTVGLGGLKEGPSAWDREHLSRNAMLDRVVPFFEGPQKVKLGGVLLVSDVDEIPKPDVLTTLRSCKVPDGVTMNSFYCYSFPWLSREEWAHPQATVYKGAEMPGLEDLRMGDGGHVFKHAAWHCSYCFGTLGEAVAKVNGFSHQEYNNFDREDNVYDYKPNNPDVPAYLLDNADRFGFMLDRNAPNANFLDVPKDGNVKGIEFE